MDRNRKRVNYVTGANSTRSTYGMSSKKKKKDRQASLRVRMVAALLANFNPIGTAVASILLAGLSTGGSAMQRSTIIPVEVCNMIEGIITLLMSVRLIRIAQRNHKSRKAWKEVGKA